MIISPLTRLFLLVLAGVLPVWQRFVSMSQDFTLRGLAAPLIDSLGIACVIVIARTKNPLVDGEQPTIKEPLATSETITKVAIAKPPITP
jgi:hypothetical protein